MDWKKVEQLRKQAEEELNNEFRYCANCGEKLEDFGVTQEVAGKNLIYCHDCAQKEIDKDLQAQKEALRDLEKEAFEKGIE